MKARWAGLWRLAALAAASLVSLQLFLVARIATLTVIDPRSTAFERSEAWRLLRQQGQVPWTMQWVDYRHISPHLARAVLAAEDAGFTEHSGIEWEAIERAWERNQRMQAQADRLNEQRERQDALRARQRPDAAPRPLPRASARVVGGSTITQQLAKNLFLGPERSVLRKSQEFVLAMALEALLSKQRILEIYLNHVEWGEGVFGAQAAARHYYRVDAARLGADAASRLAVMLPAPKRFEKRPNSGYIAARAGAIAARMGSVELP